MPHTLYNANTVLSLCISVVPHKDYKLKLLFYTSPAKGNKQALLKILLQLSTKSTYASSSFKAIHGVITGKGIEI